MTLPSEHGFEYMHLEDLISMHASRLFPGEAVVQCVPFRITRNAELDVQEDMAGDLLVFMEGVLDARRQSGCVRLEISDKAGNNIREFLKQTLDVSDAFEFPVHGPLDLRPSCSWPVYPDLNHFKASPGHHAHLQTLTTTPVCSIWSGERTSCCRCLMRAFSRLYGLWIRRRMILPSYPSRSFSTVQVARVPLWRR